MIWMTVLDFERPTDEKTSTWPASVILEVIA